MNYVKAFIVGGLICAVGQIFIDRTKLTPARILVSYVVAGVILQSIGLYEKIVEFAGPVAKMAHTRSKTSKQALCFARLRYLCATK